MKCVSSQYYKKKKKFYKLGCLQTSYGFLFYFILNLIRYYMSNE